MGEKLSFISGMGNLSPLSYRV